MKLPTLIVVITLSAVTTAAGLQGSPAGENGWARYSPEKCGLSLELPDKPKLASTEVPGELRQQVHYLNMYVYEGKEAVTVICHTSAKIALPPKSMAEGVVKGIVKGVGVSDLDYSTEPSTQSKAPITGTYKQNGVVLEINGIALSKEKHSWLIVSIYMQSNKTAQADSQRILSSIKLDGAECPEQKDVVGREMNDRPDGTALDGPFPPRLRRESFIFY